MHNPHAALYASFEAPLYHKAEHVGISSNATQVAISGAEGRVAIRELNMRRPFDYTEMFKPTYNTGRNYNFKCHRESTKDPRKEFVRPLN